MYFKKLEIYGFKSFAEKTILEFEPGVTAIVGPNGCGKSNISDAIKWVLGEQSIKQLRGSNMEDVIFNGTDKIQPVNLAEVSLTLSNEGRILPIEYDEVTVTRRIFRSGESEYLLNKNPVRLKDIAELFMDTGIGTSAYSVMEQGRVDQILSSKPDDRRVVFEEAAGITKYKAKKNEALRKLEQTEQNLLRVADIIAEVKRQIASVERQAQKAKKYQEEFEKLKSLDLKKAAFELKNMAAQKEAHSKEYHNIKEQENTFNLKIECSLGDLDKSKQELFKLEGNLFKQQDQRRLIETDINTYKNKISLNSERSEELINRKDSLEKETASFSQKISDLSGQIESLKLTISGLSENQSDKKGRLEKKENYLVELLELVKNAEAEIIKAKKDLLEVTAQQSHFKNDLTKASANIQNISARQRRLKLEKTNVHQEIINLDEKLNAFLTEFNQINQDYESLNRQREELEESKNKIEEELKTLNAEINNKQRRQLALNSKLELLENLKLHYEGFSSGVKAILGAERPNHISGVIEAIANLIEVNKNYEVAVEAALSDHAQDIVVETAAQAGQAIEYLANNNLGRARFISIDTPREPNLQEKYTANDLILGRAVDFISVDEKYRDILNIVLQDIFVVNNLEQALRLRNQIPGRLVTLKGEIVDGYSITGGSISATETASLIGRWTKIKELKEELSQIANSLNELESRQTYLENQLQQLKPEIEQCLVKLQETQANLSSKRNEQVNSEQDRKKLNDEINLLDLELEEILSQLNQLNETHESLNKNLSQVDQNHLSVQEIITSNQGLIAAKMKEREQILIEITQIKADLSSLEDKIAQQHKSNEDLERLIIDEGLLLKSRQREMEACSLRQQELLQESEELQKSINDKNQEKEALNSEIFNLTQQRSQQLSAINEMESQARKEQKSLDELKSIIYQLEIKNNQIDFNQQALQNRVEQLYKVSLETLPADIEEGINREEIDNNIKEIKDKLESMGTVNLVAIEEHQELQERFSFLTAQQDDLIQAKDQLSQAINKINQTTREMFKETFKRIQVEFRNFFKMLFGGGEAELFLIDEENTLESGIDIIARPPGKKLQNISLLSGGEKALTATALLFSFFKIKPSPFCVMDEIDAPLDEVNIDRFCRVLQDFVKQSQFIIITHNKKTINTADVMYGITMAQSGISKIVSVKFSERKTLGKEKEEVIA